MKLWLPQPSDGSQPAVGVIGAQRLIPSLLFFLNSVTIAVVEVRDKMNLGLLRAGAMSLH